MIKANNNVLNILLRRKMSCDMVHTFFIGVGSYTDTCNRYRTPRLGVTKFGLYSVASRRVRPANKECVQ